jgi:hypothetical protein
MKNMPTNNSGAGSGAEGPALRENQPLQRADARRAGQQKSGRTSARGRRRRGSERLSVPASAHELSPYDFPISTRLTNILLKQNIKRLGELDGVELRQLKDIKSCGWKTVAELVRLTGRIAAGEFALSAPAISADSIDGLLEKFEELIDELPAREREMVWLRIGAGKDQRVWTLRKIGSRFHVTRERVRQVVEKMFALIRAGGGPGMAGQLESIATFCAQRACPLTVPLLAQWLGHSKSNRRFPLACYVRVLGGVESKISAWPQGQGPTGTQEGRAKTIITVLEGALGAHDRPVSARKAFDELKANNSLRELTVPEFLAAVKTARRVVLQFPKPDQPKVTLRGKRG